MCCVMSYWHRLGTRQTHAAFNATDYATDSERSIVLSRRLQGDGHSQHGLSNADDL
jgi:hypothetical protein